MAAAACLGPARSTATAAAPDHGGACALVVAAGFAGLASILVAAYLLYRLDGVGPYTPGVRTARCCGRARCSSCFCCGSCACYRTVGASGAAVIFAEAVDAAQPSAAASEEGWALQPHPHPPLKEGSGSGRQQLGGQRPPPQCRVTRASSDDVGDDTGLSSAEPSPNVALRLSSWTAAERT
jgi:hypothetical protein